MSGRVCVITGVGPGNGAAFSRRFAAEGFRVAMLARSEDTLRGLERELPAAKGYPTDVTRAEAVARSFARIREELGPVEVLIHNAGSGVFGSFRDVTPEAFEDAWRTNAYALFLCAREAVGDMERLGQGAVVVIGATASLRGGANFAAFAAAKAAQRALAQSMARLLGPRHIHVAHVVIDGVIDTPRTRSFFENRPEASFLKPERIAESVHHLVEQDPSSWTFELDVRPFGESW